VPIENDNEPVGKEDGDVEIELGVMDILFGRCRG